MPLDSIADYSGKVGNPSKVPFNENKASQCSEAQTSFVRTTLDIKRVTLESCKFEQVGK